MAAHVGRASMLPEVAPTLRQMTRAGLSAATISERLGVTPRTVVRWRKALGISRPVPAPVTSHERDRMRTLLSDGASYNEVARTIGRSAPTIAHAFPGHGWTSMQSGQFAAFVAKANMRERGVL